MKEEPLVNTTTNDSRYSTVISASEPPGYSANHVSDKRTKFTTGSEGRGAQRDRVKRRGQERSRDWVVIGGDEVRAQGANQKKTCTSSDSGHDYNGDKVSVSNSLSKSQRKLVEVENAKKIWGTLRSTTVAAVDNVIKRTVSESLASSLHIKRKYRVSSNGSIKKWWYVLRGDKSDVELLEKEWGKVSLHTGWRLESVFSFEDSDSSPTDSLLADTSSPASHVADHVSTNQSLNTTQSTINADVYTDVSIVQQSTLLSKDVDHVEDCNMRSIHPLGAAPPLREGETTQH